jgi:hypothetical protein
MALLAPTCPSSTDCLVRDATRRHNAFMSALSGSMRRQAQNHVGVTAEQIRSDHQVSVERSRASARLLARPVNFAANLLAVVWTILKAVARP